MQAPSDLVALAFPGSLSRSNGGRRPPFGQPATDASSFDSSILRLFDMSRQPRAAGLSGFVNFVAFEILVQAVGSLQFDRLWRR
jgi:hypothetical protein